MSNKDVKDHASTYFVPFLLGSNKLSHKLGAKILRKYSITSLILDQKRSAYDVFSLSTRFVKLSDATNHKIVADELSSIAEQYPYALPILIPCTPKYIELVKEQESSLELFFVLCDAQRVFSDSPLANIP